jgi:hypothetical protein
MRIETQTEFETWLDSNFWLRDVLINDLEPYPKTTSESAGHFTFGEPCVTIGIRSNHFKSY